MLNIRKVSLLTIVTTLLLVLPLVRAQQTPGQVEFPTAPDTAASLIEVKDNAKTVLSLSLSSSATTIKVGSTASFPATGLMWINGREIATYTGKTANTFTGCLRGQFGTPAIVHASGVTVEQRISAANHNTLSLAIRNIETKLGATASTPSLGTFLKGIGAGLSAHEALTSAEVVAALGFTPAAIGGAGTGNVTGPPSSVDSELAVYLGTTGTEIKRATGTGFAKLTNGVLSTAAQINLATEAAGILPNASFPATLPAASGANLNSLNASNIGSGILPLGRLAGIGNAQIDANAAIAFTKLNLPNKNLANYADLSAAVTAIGSTQTTLEISAPTTVSASLTVPANVTLLMAGTGLISVSGSQTLTINGPVEAPLRQVFTGAGSVIITKQTAVPQWWGATGATRVVLDGAMTVGGTTLTSATAVFTAAMVGWLIDIEGSGASVAGIDGVTARDNQAGTISAWVSPTEVTVSFAAVATVSGKQVKFGPNDTAALQKAVVAASSVYIPPGNYAHNAQLSPKSNQVIYGDGQGVSILTSIGPTRSSTTADFDQISIVDAVSSVTIKDLSVVGCNLTALQVTTVPALSFAIKLGTGAGGAIKDIVIQNVEMAYIYGMGLRSNGDSGDQAGGAATCINWKILDCFVHHNSDNGLNPHVGGGLLIRGCTLTENGASAIEFAGSRVQIVNNHIARNRNVGLALGGLGNPSLGVDSIVTGNRIERNGTANLFGSGIQVGGNVVHALIANNIIRENAIDGIGVTDGGAEFSTLSRDIRIVANQIISNGIDGTSGAGHGVLIGMDNVVVEGNDIFDDNVTGFTQRWGIVATHNGSQLLRNQTRGHSDFDYEFIQCTNILFITEQPAATQRQYEPNGHLGTVDTSGTAVTWETGQLFSTAWVGVPIKINSVPYLISAVAAAPTGNFTRSGLVVTRTSGPSFDMGWAGQYVKLGPTYYFPIASVAGGDTLTISNPIGVTVPASGAWELRGSMDLTLAATAGSQGDVAFVVPPHVVRPPNTGFVTADFFTAPVFDAAAASTFYIGLTADVTSSTLANGTNDQTVTFIIQQDPAVARTFAFPANVKGATAIGTTLSGVNVQSFKKNGSNWYAVAPGVINQT